MIVGGMSLTGTPVFLRPTRSHSPCMSNSTLVPSLSHTQYSISLSSSSSSISTSTTDVPGKYCLMKCCELTGISWSAHDISISAIRHASVPIHLFILLIFSIQCSTFNVPSRLLSCRRSCFGHWRRISPCNVRPPGRRPQGYRSVPRGPAPARRSGRHLLSGQCCGR